MEDKDKEYDPLKIVRMTQELRHERIRKEKAEEEERLREYRRSQGLLENPEPKKQHFDSVNTLENDEATVLYIAVMIIGALFYDRILIWITATVIFFLFMTRHSRRKQK